MLLDARGLSFYVTNMPRRRHNTQVLLPSFYIARRRAPQRADMPSRAAHGGKFHASFDEMIYAQRFRHAGHTKYFATILRSAVTDATKSAD